MAVKIYFETMTSGMAARLDPRYRITKSHAGSPGKVPGNGSGSRYLPNRFGYTEVIIKK